MKYPQVDEYHAYGLIKISANQYEKCGDRCCKSGGYPSIWKHDKEED